MKLNQNLKPIHFLKYFYLLYDRIFINFEITSTLNIFKRKQHSCLPRRKRPRPPHLKNTINPQSTKPKWTKPNRINRPSITKQIEGPSFPLLPVLISYYRPATPTRLSLRSPRRKYYILGIIT